MKNNKFIIITILLFLSLCSCGILVDTNTTKSAELTERYSFYKDSVASIRSACNVSPEEADEIFLVLVNNCGVDKKITITSYINAPYTVMYGLKTLSMTIDNHIVSEVFDGETQLYPVIASETSMAKETETTPNRETPEDILTTEYETPESIEATENIVPNPSNILSTAPVREAPVMNGFNNERIGTRGYIEITKDDLKSITVEQYSKFVENTVKDSGYNWFTIFCGDGTGICFAGSMGFIADYGKLDEEGSITETIGYITISDNGYSYEPAE